MSIGGRVSAPQQAVDRGADVAAAASGALVAGTWISQANEVLTLVATVVAILSGLFALGYHYRRWRRERAAYKREIKRAADELAKQWGSRNGSDGTED